MKRALWLVYLVTVWSLVEYPLGVWLFVIGGAFHGAGERAQEIARRHRNSNIAQVVREVARRDIDGRHGARGLRL